VTINLPKLAYTSITQLEFFEELAGYTELAAKINNAKRTLIEKRIRDGNMPLYSLGIMDTKLQYSTTGVTGIAEACEIMGMNILENQGQNFVLAMLSVINQTNDLMSERYSAPHNCEQVPAENSSIKLAKKDFVLGLNRAAVGDAPQYELYSNQFIPLITEADMLDRIELQGLFDQHFSGGAICHINVEEKINDTERIKELIRYCAVRGVVYWAINYNLQQCANGHMAIGKGETCSICGAPVEDNFTRVVGFLTNTKNWHKVRRERDYPHRQFYKGPK